MAKITIEIISSTKTKHEIHVFDKTQVRIGRGFNNDLILFDSYISANHAVIHLDEKDTLVIDDCDSRNGIFIIESKNFNYRNKKKIKTSMQLVSGDLISIGHTVLRIFQHDHPVPLAKSFKKPAVSFFAVGGMPNMLYALVGFFIVNYFHFASFYPYINNPLKQMLFGEFIAILTLMVWAGIWALTGKLIRHRFRFQTHFTIICSYSLITVPIVNMGGFLGFIFADPVAELIFFTTFSVFAFALLLFLHLTYATYLKIHTRIVSSLTIPLAFCVLFIMGQYAFKDNFTPTPPYYHRLKPPLLRWVKLYDIDDFVAKTGKVFSKAREKIK